MCVGASSESIWGGIMGGTRGELRMGSRNAGRWWCKGWGRGRDGRYERID